MTLFPRRAIAAAPAASVDIVRKRFEDLSSVEIATWARLQETLPEFRSPYFRPEFARLVAEVRDDVEVGVLAREGVPVGFFPFQVDARRVASPVGSPVSDYQGVIASPETVWREENLLRACRLSAYAFDHLLSGSRGFEQGVLSSADSPVADLNDGYDAYRAAKNAESDVIRFSERMERRLAREGDVRFVWQGDAGLAELVHSWKRPRYVETGAFDPFETPWTAKLIERCLQAKEAGFSGGVAALSVGDRTVAANVYLRSGDVVHSWIPAFDSGLSSSSPGSVLFHESLRQAAEIGMRRLDFGKGDERYKLRLMTGAIAVAEGGVDRRVIRRVARRGWYGLRGFVRSSRWGRSLLSRYRRLRQACGRR